MAAPLRPVLLRRLFSWTGLVPLGAFLVIHTLISARVLHGEAAYGRAVDAVRAVPALLLLEAIVVFGPLALHGGIGLWMLVTQTPLDSPSPYPPSVRVAMRATGGLALAFLALHLLEYRFGAAGGPLGGRELAARLDADLSSTWFGVPWRAGAYLLGTASVTFHFAAGMWGSVAAWRLRENRVARRWMAWGTGAAAAATWLVLANVIVFEATGARLFGEASVEGDGAQEPCPTPSGGTR